MMIDMSGAAYDPVCCMLQPHKEHCGAASLPPAATFLMLDINVCDRASY
jgi:hypothetical protein